MRGIAFIDTEIEPKSKKILDIGSVKGDGSKFHSTSTTEFTHFLQGTEFVCGHNIIRHDLKYVGKTVEDAGVNPANIIDTLFLSPLLFPTKPYHALLKDDKLQSEERNNPLNDAVKARDLFEDEISTFNTLDKSTQEILYILLNDKREFGGFFRFIDYQSTNSTLGELVYQTFKNEICEQVKLERIASDYPTELAYSLSIIRSFIDENNIYSITPPWVLKNYPDVERIVYQLRNRPCLTGCAYCDKALDPLKGLKKFFGFDAFRRYGGEPLQEKAVKAAIDNKSILAVFPTGGGKSITFQVPALMSGENTNGLTIVISPLQSLMKDQVDNLEKIGITKAVTINGMLDPIERAKSLERVEDGSASILYLSPESLRSQTIERLIMGRKIVRFVIDEAHCFSSWGQDFRVDYLYIGDFIKQIQEKKNLTEGIPISCFTATAKQKVIEDIRSYFKEKLSTELELYSSKASRTNLQYKVFEKENEEEKYQAIRDLIEEKKCPTIIYVSRTKKAYTLAERLNKDGFNAKPYHGKMEVTEKTSNQNAFISGEVPIMVATSAFGMGVDKKDVGMVIHYEISDSLENYIQEAGRAGRDENINADCFVLFNEEDLSKHFILLNQTKLSIKEIQQIWRAIKETTKLRSTISNSALEIARKAGWDDNVREIETRVTTAIAALEDAGYIKRGQNMPKVFANSILCKNAQEAIDKINSSERFEETQKANGIRVIKKLISSKNKKQLEGEAAESRIDYISEHLGIAKEEVINIVNLLREEKILADAKDLTAFIKRGENRNRSLNIVESYAGIEHFLLSSFDQTEKTFQLKLLNEEAESRGCVEVTTNKLKTIINFWSIKNWIKRQYLEYSKNHLTVVSLQPRDLLKEKLEKRQLLAKFIVEYLFEKINTENSTIEKDKEECLVEFSVHELKEEFERKPKLFESKITHADVEDALFFLSRIEALKIEGGFLVLYNRLTIERIEQDRNKQYTKDDYRKLNRFYESKVQQIHMVGEYAKKMINDYRDALQFVEDYFQLNYNSFLKKYFPGSKSDTLKLKMTPGKFKQLFGELSPTQLKIINESGSMIVVAAGPGSGKTKVLVHKLASLLLMEDVKHEQLLMLTFSRAAATEFKKRLLKLIGNAANYIEIKTFHSFCFDLLGKVGSIEKSDEILKKTIDKIKNREVEASGITKAVLVIDEAQDMDKDEFHLVKTLMDQNEDMRVIAVGDDDQNIYEFRGANSQFLKELFQTENAVKHELVENYRSKKNLVDFSNQFASRIQNRLKEIAIIAKQTDNGKIKLIRYQSKNIIIPTINDVLKTGLKGTTCILTKTNEEALQIAGLLIKNKVPAKVVQSNDGFNLYNLAEVRFLFNQLNLHGNSAVISEETWASVKKEWANKYSKSANWEACRNIIKEFEDTNPIRKYKSDLDIFVRESKIEDFFDAQGETIFVSTIHKAKGKEFDNVFLMLENFNPVREEEKRQIYVALTRAKQNLTIHLNTDFLDNISVENIERIDDNELYLVPNEFSMNLGLKDIWLDYSMRKQDVITELVSGDTLILGENECLTSNGQSILKFSTQFSKRISELKQKNYQLKSAVVNFVVYWLKEGTEREVKIILPRIQLIKSICD